MKRLPLFVDIVSFSLAIIFTAVLAWAASTSTVPWQSGGTGSDFGSLSEYNDTSDPNDYTYYNDGTARRITVLNLLKALEAPLTSFEISADNLPAIYGVIGDPTPWRLFYSNGSGVLTELEFGVAGTALVSNGVDAAPSWDVVAGGGGGSIGGSTGSVDNAILTADGPGGSTLQATAATISDAGTVNIPAGQTYQIDGVAHTHNYQPLDADLTTWAGVTPSANGQSLVALANYAAMLSALGGQPLDADLTALAAISGVRGDVLYYGASGWTRLAKGTSGQVLKMATLDPVWGTDNNDGGSGISRWDQLLAPTANLSLALSTYTSSFTSSLNTAGSVWTISNTLADITADVSLIDLKYADDGDANGYFLRGYDNSGADLKWYIGPEGAAKFYSLETYQSATGGVLDLLEGAANGTNYIRFKAPDSLAADYIYDLPAVNGSLVVEGSATGGVILGDSSPDAAGELGYASAQLIFHDGTAARNVAKAGTLTDTKWCTSDGVVINCTTNAPAGAGDFMADGSVPLTGALTSTGGQNIGSTTAEFGDIFIGDGKALKGQADQSNTLTSSATGWATSLDLTVGGGDIVLPSATAGLRITGGNGLVTFKGEGDGTDEDLTVNLNSANVASVSSSTGVTSINFGSIGLVTTGTIQGALGINSDANGMSRAEMLAAGCYGTVFMATGAGAWNLPPAETGMNVLVYSTTAASIIVDPDNADTIILNGVALSAGDSITSGGGAGDFISLVAIDGNTWVTLGRSGTWTDTN